MNTQAKPNSSGYYPPAKWNKLSFEERDKIHKEHKEKPDQNGTSKQKILVTFLLNMSPPLLGQCSKFNLPMKILPIMLKTLCLNIPTLAMHLEARQT